jgi:hypothetical protein
MLSELNIEIVEFITQLTKNNPTWLKGNKVILE